MKRFCLFLLLFFAACSPVWATTYYAQADANWNAALEWNTVAGGGGSDGTPGAGDVCDLNTHTVTLNVDPTVATVQASGATGTLTTSGTRVLTANVAYAGSNTAAGMVTVTTGASLTITGKVSNTSTGYAVVASGTGTLIVSNTGDVAVTCSAAGHAVRITGTATGTITRTDAGSAVTGTAGTSVYISGGTVTINGDVVSTSAAGTISCQGGSGMTLNGNMSTVGAGILSIGGGVFNWTGARTLAAGTDCRLYQTSGTINLATASAALALANSGSFIWWKNAGSVVLIAAGGTAAITQQTATAQAGTPNGTITVTGPTLPAVANVWTGTGTFGYAGGLLTPTKVASSITNCSAGNVKKDVVIGDVTGTYDQSTGFTDPGIAHVEKDTAYTYNGSNLTGTYDPITGNYTDPGIAHVQLSTTYKFGGSTLTGTLTAGSTAAPPTD